MTSGWSVTMTQFMGLEDSIVKGHRAGSLGKGVMRSHDKQLRVRETPRLLLLNNDQVHWCSQEQGENRHPLLRQHQRLPLFLLPLPEHQPCLVNLETGWRKTNH